MIPWLITAVYYFDQYIMRSAPAVMIPELSAGLGIVGGTGQALDLHAYQTTFEPLLYGVGLAILLTLLLRETGPAARRLVPAEALS